MSEAHRFLNDPFFNILTDRERSVLQSNASVIDFKADEMFLKNGSRLFSIYYIQQGQLKIKDENNKSIDLLGKGDFLGLRYLYNEEPIFFSAYGTQSSQIIQIEKNVFKKFASTNSNFLVNLFNRSIDNAALLSRNLLAFKNQKIHGALASFLIFYNEKNCLYNLTQKEISEMLGYSRENVNKTLNDFLHQEYIAIIDGAIIIKNMDAIQKLHKYG